jgi:type IX secretion system PorP/SprF family membrane protein
MKNRVTTLVLLCWASLSQLHAQDAQLTQFYATPTYINPAFAGTGLQTRFGLVMRDQWPAIPGAFVTANFAIDHNLSDVNSGLGLMVHHDRAGSGALRYTSITGQYAYEIELKRKVFLRPALQFGWVNHAVDYSRLVFGDQLARGGTVGTYENMDGTSIGYADMGGGLLFFTPKLWLGTAIHHLNRPNQSLLLNEARLPMKFSMHGGYRMSVRTPVVRKEPQSFVFAFNYKAQDKYDQFDLGAYFEMEPFFAGLWYRGLPIFKRYAPGYANNDAIAVLVGTIIEDLRIGYSYDITVSRLATAGGGAHEITVGYELVQRHKKRAATKRRIVPCAKF